MTTTIQQPMTPRQKQILSWIARYTSENGFPPTIREGQAAFAFGSPNGFVCHVDALVRKGWLLRNEGQCRTLRVAKGGDA